MGNRVSNENYHKAVEYAGTLMRAGTPLVVFDLETTGFSAKNDRIVSFSAIKVQYENGIGVVKEEKDIFINPGFHIPDAASAKNHITDDMVKDCPKEEAVIQEIFDFFGDKPFVAGYNSMRFDQRFMDALYRRNLGIPFETFFHLDVFKMAKEKLEGSHALEDAARELGVANGLTFHRSLDDVYATYRCMNILKAMYEEPEEEGQKEPYRIKGVKYLPGFRHEQKRIAVWTEPKSKTEFSVRNQEWTSDHDFDLKKMRKEILAHYHVNNEADLLKRLSTFEPCEIGPAKVWEKGDLQRIYVATSPKSTTYVNVKTGYWSSDHNFDFMKLQKAVFQSYQANSARSLYEKLKPSAGY